MRNIAKMCSPGYLGRNCTQICPYPNYGLECQGKCDCEERLCDIATGCYSVSDGCRTGYYGERCMFKCRVPVYGKHCQQICQCDESICHYITGCPVKEATASFGVETSTSMFSSISKEEVKVVPILVLILSISLAAVVTISFALIIAICRRMKSTNDNCPSADQQTEAGEYIDTRDAILSSQQYSAPCRSPSKPVQKSSIKMEARKSSVSTRCSSSANYYESVEFGSLKKSDEYSEIKEDTNDQDSHPNENRLEHSSHIEMNT
ncbi:multiple epidermal growth factor-like domains protein 10 [Saccostrea cucullata]|uniref:multiple epidermal growth factor-like domains protein 10 n=1 Tax=Saccostrea cuccullata TaxID=36930 RepID=UPI002ED625D2